MNHFRVLLLDDKQHYLASADEHFSKPREVKIIIRGTDSGQPREEDVAPVEVHLASAGSFDEAMNRIHASFFHLALLDPRLHKKNDDLFEGIIVMKKLRELRPSCERIIHTDYGYNNSRGMETVVRQLDPIDGNAQHILTKNLFQYFELIEQRAAHWLWVQVSVEDPGMIVQMLDEGQAKRSNRRKRGEGVATTRDEIDFLISALFGQGQEWSRQQEGINVARVVLARFTEQGFSAAAVVKASTFSRDGHRGIECVLKFASREYISREYTRYSQYVRFRLAVHHRVELLGWMLGDTVGVLCYNFAGETSLTKQLLQRDPAFFTTLDRLFDPDNKKWYAEHHKVSLKEYMTKSPYKVDVTAIRQKIVSYARNLIKQLNGSITDDELTVAGVNLGDPADVLNRACNHPILGKVRYGCLIHGDLHCDNVLVDIHGEPMFIDYYTVGPGPRALDFATLEASLRLLSLQHWSEADRIEDDPRPDPEVLSDLIRLLQAEEAIAVVGTESVPDHPDFWFRASVSIRQLAMRNFHYRESDPSGLSPADSLTPAEYAATCLLWGFRLFMIESETMTARKRTRLLVWILAVAKTLG